MSHSQFQSKRFILRLAWLSLWDERMTTGRINQVAFPTETRQYPSTQISWIQAYDSAKQSQQSFARQAKKQLGLRFVASSTFILGILHLHQSLCSDEAKIKEISWYQGQNRPCKRKLLNRFHVSSQVCKNHPIYPLVFQEKEEMQRVLLKAFTLLSVSLQHSEDSFNWLLRNAKQCAKCVPRSKKQSAQADALLL